MYPNSETFELFYNENVADKWIPNLFGNNPFQSNVQYLLDTRITELPLDTLVYFLGFPMFKKILEKCQKMNIQGLMNSKVLTRIATSYKIS